MLAKCSNPRCTAAFRYLEGGRLFLLEEDAEHSVSKSGRLEYFWLCNDCSSTMTLRLGRDDTVATVRVPEPCRDAASDVAVTWTERNRGLFLRSVNSFLLKPLPNRRSMQMFRKVDTGIG